MGYREYAYIFKMSDPPHYEIVGEVDVPNRAPEYEDRLGLGLDWENVVGVFYARQEDEGKPLNWSIKNKTDNELLDNGQFTPSQSKDYCLNALVLGVATLRGKTVEFKLWNPNENSTKPLLVYGIVIGGPTY